MAEAAVLQVSNHSRHVAIEVALRRFGLVSGQHVFREAHDDDVSLRCVCADLHSAKTGSVKCEFQSM